MNYIKRSVLFLLMGGSFIAFAQEQDSTAVEQAVLTESSDSVISIQEAPILPYSDSKHAIAVNFGIQGAGLEYAYSFNEHFAGRLRGMYNPLTLNDYKYNLDDQDVSVDIKVNSLHIDLIFDYYPIQNSSFKLMLGASYFLTSDVGTQLQIEDTIYFGDDGPDADDKGDFVFYPNDIGYIDIAIDWNSFAPYAGLGWGRAVPKGRVGFGIELGAYYLGAPNVDINTTGILDINDAEEQELEDNLASFGWYPQMNLRISIKL